LEDFSKEKNFVGSEDTPETKGNGGKGPPNAQEIYKKRPFVKKCDC